MSKKSQKPKEVTVVGQKTSAQITAPVTPVAVSIPISFDDWWLQTQGKYNFRPELKASVRKHFESRGFMDYRKFNEGLRDFGYRT